MVVILGIVSVVLVSEMGVFFHPKSKSDHSFVLLSGFLALELFGLIGLDVSGGLSALMMVMALLGVVGIGWSFLWRYQASYQIGHSEYLVVFSVVLGVLLGCMLISHLVVGLAPDLNGVMAGVICLSFLGSCYYFVLRLNMPYLRGHFSRSFGRLLGGGLLLGGGWGIFSLGFDDIVLGSYFGVVIASWPAFRWLGQRVSERFLYPPTFFRRRRGLIRMVKSLRCHVQNSSIGYSISVLLPEILGSRKVRYFLDMGDGQGFAFQDETGFFNVQNLSKSSAFFELFSPELGPVCVSSFEQVFSEFSPSILKQVRSEFESWECDVVLPLYGRADRVIGVLMIDGPYFGWRFSVEILDLFSELGMVLSSIVETNYFYRRFGLQQHRLKSLGELSLVLGSSFEIDHMLSRACSFLRGEYHGQGVVAFLTREKDSFFASYYSHLPSLPEPLWELCLDDLDFEFSGKDGLFVYSMTSKENSVLDRICSFYNAGGCLVLPIGEVGQFDGMMVMILDDTQLRLSMTDRMILKGFSRLVGAQYRNSLLFQDVRQAQVYHEDVLQHLAAGVVICDGADLVVEINLMAQRLFGVSSDALIGLPISHLSALSSLGMGGHEVCLSQGDQERVCSVIRDVHDSGSLYVISDITELHYLQKETHRISRLRSLGTMAAGIAHEIRNPLVPIKTFTQLLEKQWGDSVFLDRYRGMVVPQLLRIQTMCDSLLRLGDDSSMAFSEVSLRDVLTSVVDLLSQDGRGEGVQFHLDIPELSPISGDADRLCQVFLNLCLNGIESLPEHSGELWIQASELADDGIVEVRVRDNGCGMSTESQTRLFDPFYSEKVSGTGLGMSIVHKICEVHSAGIRVFSKPDEGTEFVLSFPRGENV